MRLFLFLVIVLITTCNCTRRLQSMEYSSKNEKVTLIFKDAPIQTKIINEFVTMSTGNPYSCISYIDSNLNICNFLPRNIGLDTLVLSTFNGYANVYHTYKVSETVQYLFTAGDTIFISYNSKGRPYAKSLVNENNTIFYNINMQGPIVEKSGYSIWATLGSELYIATFRFIKRGGNKKSPSLYAKFGTAYINLDSVEQEYNKCMAELTLSLDTLLIKNRINKSQYRYSIKTIEANNMMLDEFYKRRHGIKDTFVKASFIAYNDSLIYNLSYHYNIFSAADKQSFDKSGVFQAQGFDKILEQNIPPITKKIMLRHLISQMDEYNTSQYINKYIVETGDSLYYNKLDYGSLTNISHTNIMENGYSNDFILKTINGDVLNYGELIQRNKGKVIYVDFWASWCAPCKGEMPSSIKLHNEYRDKDVIFIYLAYNDKQAVWETALKECGISQFKENYIIANSQSAEFVKEIKLSTIPRFMLYNKEGKLINIDAPRPSSKEIKGVIDELLKGK